MVTTDERAAAKRSLARMIHKGIEEMRKNHMRSVAEAQIYSQYSIGELMAGAWNEGDEWEEDGFQLPLHHVASLVDVPVSIVFSILKWRIESRTDALLESYSGGDFRKTLEQLRDIALGQIEQAESLSDTQSILCRAASVIQECTESRPWFESPILNEHGGIARNLVL